MIYYIWHIEKNVGFRLYEAEILKAIAVMRLVCRRFNDKEYRWNSHIYAVWERYYYI